MLKVWCKAIHKSGWARIDGEGYYDHIGELMNPVRINLPDLKCIGRQPRL